MPQISVTLGKENIQKLENARALGKPITIRIILENTGSGPDILTLSDEQYERYQKALPLCREQNQDVSIRFKAKEVQNQGGLPTVNRNDKLKNEKNARAEEILVDSDQVQKTKPETKNNFTEMHFTLRPQNKDKMIKGFSIKKGALISLNKAECATAGPDILFLTPSQINKIELTGSGAFTMSYKQLQVISTIPTNFLALESGKSSKPEDINLGESVQVGGSMSKDELDSANGAAREAKGNDETKMMLKDMRRFIRGKGMSKEEMLEIISGVISDSDEDEPSTKKK